MSIKKNYGLMLLAGTLAGLLSSAVFITVTGLRGLAFGFILTCTILLVRKYNWKPIVFLPAILLGIILGLLPPDYGELTYRSDLDPINVVNCALTIPALSAAYLARKKRILKMLSIGLLSSLLRSLSLSFSWDGVGFVIFTFPIGMLPFLIFWLLAMRITDPVNFKMSTVAPSKKREK